MMSDKSFSAIWLGDEDPNAQIISFGGLRFIRGEKVTVPADNEFADRIKGNPTFSTEGKAEPVTPAEPTEEEQAEAGEQGTAKAALKRELANRGVVLKGNPSEDTLRAKLADVTKDEGK